MNIQIALCDDNPQDIKNLSELIQSYQQEFANNFEISLFFSASELLQHHKEGHRYDIIFLDIEISNEDGIEAAQTIRKLYDYHTKIVFTTNYPKYMTESFGIHPFHYLLKEIDREQLFSVLSDAISILQKEQNSITFIETHTSQALIACDKIYYISTDNNGRNLLYIHLFDSSMKDRSTIKNYYDLLHDKDFIIPCRGYLVNLKHVATIEKNTIILDNNSRIPMSRKYEKSTRESFAKYIIRHM